MMNFDEQLSVRLNSVVSVDIASNVWMCRVCLLDDLYCK